MNKWIINGALVCLMVIMLTGVAGAEEVKYPSYVGYVNDFGNILSAETRDKLNNLIGDLEKKTAAEIAVVTIKTVAPETVEGYAVKLFEKWGIGKRGKDNGVLLLVAVKDRKMRIETGYGLEGAIPDAKASDIIQNILGPNFRAGDFNRGILQATEAIIALIAKEYKTQIAGLSPTPDAGESITHGDDTAVAIIAFLIIAAVIVGIVVLAIKFGKRGGPSSGGSSWRSGGGSSWSSGGSSGGFGGGRSGGGGASGGW